MTDVKDATITPFGRVYATTQDWAEVLYKSEPALRDSPAAAAKFVEIRAGVPSLTTTLSLSRATVMANDDLSPRAAYIRDRYLDALREVLDASSFGSVGETLEAPMLVGTHVHKIAELAAGKTPTRLLEVTETVLGGSNLADQDLTAAIGYSVSLKRYLSEYGFDYTPEVRVMRADEGWAGTADAVSEDMVLDWKTGKKLSLKQNLIQVIALADACGKTSARIVHLKQDGTFVVVEVDYTMKLWNLALRLFDIALDETHRKISELALPTGWRVYESDNLWTPSMAYNTDALIDAMRSGGYMVVDESTDKNAAIQNYLNAVKGIDVSPGGFNASTRVTAARKPVEAVTQPWQFTTVESTDDEFVIREAPF